MGSFIGGRGLIYKYIFKSGLCLAKFALSLAQLQSQLVLVQVNFNFVGSSSYFFIMRATINVS